MVRLVSPTVTETVVVWLFASVIVTVQSPMSPPPFTVNVAGVAPLGAALAGVTCATNASLGAGEGAGLAALHVMAEVKAAVSPASLTVKVCGAGLLASNTRLPGEATGIGLGDGLGLGEADALAEPLGEGLGDPFGEDDPLGEGLDDPLGEGLDDPLGEGLAVVPTL